MKGKAGHPPLLAAILGGIAAAVAIIFLIFDFRVVDGASMEPLFASGRLIVVLRPAYLLGRPARGDVVVFRSPEDGRKVVKRCAGLPSDALAAGPDSLELNGRQVPLSPSQYFHLQSLGSIPPGTFFALGDNPPASVDSRDYGPVPFSALEGRVILAAR